MLVLVFIDQSEGHLKKSSLEAMSYGAALAAQSGTEAQGVVLGPTQEDLSSLGKYGIKKIHHVNNPSLSGFDAQAYTRAIAQVAEKTGANLIVFSNNVDGKAIAPRLSVRLKAGLVSGATGLPETGGDFIVKKTVFSGKGYARIAVKTAVKIIALNPNAFTVAETGGTAEVLAFDAQIDTPKIKVTAVNKVKGEIPLTEADIVVSGGRGLKGPEHWGILEDLAKALGAATACSRPVSDSNWRPHHEHVGQTGIAIAPNLYIAIGISGAIQHLAGVNRSKVIVVINKDPEAPFFKAADYGIVGDAFEVVPRITEAVRRLKG